MLTTSVPDCACALAYLERWPDLHPAEAAKNHVVGCRVDTTRRVFPPQPRQHAERTERHLWTP